MIKTAEHLASRTNVHKIEDKNILITNIRRSLPETLNNDEYATLLHKIPVEDQSTFKNAYRELTQKELRLTGITDAFILKSLFPVISPQHIEPFEDLEKNKLRNMLDLYYTLQESENVYVLRRVPKEPHEKQIIRLLRRKDLHLPDIDRSIISDQLSACGFEREGALYYAKMRVDVTHDFFFEHHNEHIPGIMLIETFRQFAMALGHSFFGIPIDNAQLILNTISSTFKNYAELSIPVTIIGIIENVTMNKYGYLGTLDLTTQFYQLNDEIAEFKLNGQTAPKKIYKIMRKRRIDSYLGKYRYHIRPEFKHYVSIKSVESGEFKQCLLEDVSFGGFNADTVGEVLLEPDSAYEFIFFSEKIGLVYGTAENRWTTEKRTRGGFKIQQISKSDIETLKEFIVKRCVVNESRFVC